MNPGLPEGLSVIQAIQLILAPGVMINACGLLLLGINNKFTSVLNRIRALTEEKRKMALLAANREFHPLEDQRIESISRQIKDLLNRARLVRLWSWSWDQAILIRMRRSWEEYSWGVFCRLF